MQLDRVLKKMIFNLLPSSQGQGVGLGWWVGAAGKIFAAMLLHFVIPFNLICNMTKKFNFDLLTPSPGPVGFRVVCGQNVCYHVAAFRDSL